MTIVNVIVFAGEYVDGRSSFFASIIAGGTY